MKAFIICIFISLALYSHEQNYATLNNLGGIKEKTLELKEIFNPKNFYDIPLSKIEATDGAKKLTIDNILIKCNSFEEEKMTVSIVPSKNWFKFDNSDAAFLGNATYDYFNGTASAKGKLSFIFHFDNITLLKTLETTGTAGDLNLNHYIVDLLFDLHYFNITETIPTNDEMKKWGESLFNEKDNIKNSSDTLYIPLMDKFVDFYKNEKQEKTLTYTYQGQAYDYEYNLIKNEINELYEINYNSFIVKNFPEGIYIPLSSIPINPKVAPVNYLSKTIINNTLYYAQKIGKLDIALDQSLATDDFQFTIGYLSVAMPKVRVGRKPYDTINGKCLANIKNYTYSVASNSIIVEISYACNLGKDLAKFIDFSFVSNLIVEPSLGTDQLIMTIKKCEILGDITFTAASGYTLDYKDIANNYFSSVFDKYVKSNPTTLGTGFKTDPRKSPKLEMFEDYIIFSDYIH